MLIIRYGEPLNVLMADNGHPDLRDPFMAMFDDIQGVARTLVEQTAAARLTTPEGMKNFYALALYDMSSLDLRSPDPTAFVDRVAEVRVGRRTFRQTFDDALVLHPVIAGRPAWPQYGARLSARVFDKPSRVKGRAGLHLGYRDNVAFQANALAPWHIGLDGLPSCVPMTDELYLYKVFDDATTPRLSEDHAFTRNGAYSAQQAVQSRIFCTKGWAYPDGSSLIGGVKRARSSRLVHLQLGDGPATYQNPRRRRLLKNAIGWGSSHEAMA